VSELAEQLGADVLVQAQIRPTRQTREGLAVRIVAEAVNTRGGQSIGRAVVDVPPPLEKRQMNKYTRFLARKLMDDMTGTWQNMPATSPERPSSPPAARAPAVPPVEPTAPATPAPPVAPVPPTAPVEPLPPTPPVAPLPPEAPTSPIAPPAPPAPLPPTPAR
jgi:hypothetical protein